MQLVAGRTAISIAAQDASFTPMRSHGALDVNFGCEPVVEFVSGLETPLLGQIVSRLGDHCMPRCGIASFSHGDSPGVACPALLMRELLTGVSAVGSPLQP